MTLVGVWEDKGVPTLLLGIPQGRHTLLISVQPCALEYSDGSGFVRDCSRRGMLLESPRRIPERKYDLVIQCSFNVKIERGVIDKVSNTWLQCLVRTWPSYGRKAMLISLRVLMYLATCCLQSSLNSSFEQAANKGCQSISLIMCTKSTYYKC